MILSVFTSPHLKGYLVQTHVCMNDVVVYIRLRMHLGLMKTVNYEIMVSKE